MMALICKNGAPALDRGLAILELLDGAAGGLNLTDISVAVGSPKNSTSRFLQTIERRLQA